MKWNYNKKEPWLSGLERKACTRRYIKEDPSSPFRYFGRDGKWTQFRTEAKEYTQDEVHAETRWKSPNERWLLVHD